MTAKSYIIGAMLKEVRTARSWFFFSLPQDLPPSKSTMPSKAPTRKMTKRSR